MTSQVYTNDLESVCDAAVHCENGGICSEAADSVLGFTCACPSGFTGIACEIGNIVSTTVSFNVVLVLK